MRKDPAENLRQIFDLMTPEVIEILQNLRSSTEPADPRTRQTLDEALQDYFDHRQARVSAGTNEIDKERSKPLASVFGRRLLSEISAEDISAYQQARLAVGISGRTINMEVELLRRLLKRAKLWEGLAEDVVLFSERNDIARVPSPKEIKKLFRIAEANPRWFNAYTAGKVALATTCRHVEMRHVRWRDVDFKSRNLHISTTKGRTAGVRIIPLNSTAISTFRALLARARQRGMARPEHFVWPARDVVTRKLDPTRPQGSFRNAWRSMTRAAGLRGLRMHDLRHTAITEMSEAGVPDGVIMAVAGHKSRQMLDLYTHIRLPALRAAVESLCVAVPRKPVQAERSGRLQKRKVRS